MQDERWKSFDHHGEDFAKDPYGAFAEMRSKCPVVHSEAHGGYYVFSRYEDVVRIAKDDETFSSADGVVVPPPSTGRNIPIDLDPPEFFPYRKLLNPLFSPAAVDPLEPQVRELADELIDATIESGHVEFVHDLASPLTSRLTLRLIGFPEDRWEDFAMPVHHGTFQNARRDPSLHQKVIDGYAWMRSEIRTAISERRREPRDDTLTYLVQAQVEGHPMDDQVIEDMVVLLFNGGLDTTQAAIGNALIHLDRDRALRRQLVERPDSMSSAIEEFLRFEAPVQGLARTVTRDVEVGGCSLRRGDRLLMLWGSANRDSEEFDDPDHIVPGRHPNRHLAFGVGNHRCIGSNLARLQFRVAVEQVLRRLPDYAIDDGGPERAPDCGTVFGHVRIPAHFTPGRPRAS